MVPFMSKCAMSYWLLLFWFFLHCAIVSFADVSIAAFDEVQHKVEHGILDILYSTFGTNKWYKESVEDHCDWDRIVCHKNTGLITEIYFSWSNLQGSIPSEIGNFGSLTYLSLSNNPGLVGTIPDEFGDLTALKWMHLSNTGITGTIPRQLEGLAALDSLDLSLTGLSGSIPKYFGDLRALEGISLSNTNINGTIPKELESLSSLEWLNLSNTALTGRIPKEFGNLSALEWLDLSTTRIAGPIPKDFGELILLEKLVLSNTTITGTIPKQLGKLTSLEWLDLSITGLSGPIPNEFGELLSLEMLTISDTSINGTITEQLGKLTALDLLDFSFTALNGSIPKEIGKLKLLTKLCLSNTALTGTIPKQLGESGLVSLDIFNTSITGTIPTELGNLRGLIYLFLDNNSLDGTIPTELGELTALKQLYLSNTTLAGTIPKELGSLQKLEEFSLSNTAVIGTIPKEFGNLHALIFLNLSNTALTGTIPNELGNMSKLMDFWLSGAKITGTIPSSLGNNPSLTTLNIENNELSGSIPNSILNSTSLQTVSLRNNLLNATIKSILSHGISNIGKLFLSNNMIHGTIPDFQVLEFNGLHQLYLDHNCITGSIPFTMDSLIPVIEDLNLSYNMGINGKFECRQYIVESKQRCFEKKNCENKNNVMCCNDYCSSDYDDGTSSTFTCLNGLGLQGTISPTIGNFPFLKMLDLSHNHLSGSIPTEISNLLRIKTLKLNNNILSGVIPYQLGRIEALDHIELVNNTFFGTLAPLSLCTFRGSFFDLRKDNLIWCPLERTTLNHFFDTAKGVEWTNNRNWANEYIDHCEWHGVICTDNSVLELRLSNNGLSGQISTHIGELQSLVKLDLRDNDIQAYIPSQISNLRNLKHLLLSYNNFIGNITKLPMELDSLLLQNNRLTGTVSFSLSKNSMYDYIADCGTPSNFENVLICADCTYCCNNLAECEKTEKKYDAESDDSTIADPFIQLLLVAFSAIFLCCTVAIYSGKKARELTSIDEIRDLKILKDKLNSVGDSSVYIFFRGANLIGWLISILTCIIQVYILSVFVDAAKLVLDDDKSDWIYEFWCPRDSMECIMFSGNLWKGWVVFGILMFLEIGPDLKDGIFIIWTAPRMVQYTLWKRIRYVISGIVVCLFAVLSLFVSLQFNIAIARTNTELIINTVILIFLNDMDEQFYCVLDYFSNGWLEKLVQATQGKPASTGKIEYKESTQEVLNKSTHVIPGLNMSEAEMKNLGMTIKKPEIKTMDIIEMNDPIIMTQMKAEIVHLKYNKTMMEIEMSHLKFNGNTMEVKISELKEEFEELKMIIDTLKKYQ